MTMMGLILWLWFFFTRGLLTVNNDVAFLVVVL